MIVLTLIVTSNPFTPFPIWHKTKERGGFPPCPSIFLLLCMTKAPEIIPRCAYCLSVSGDYLFILKLYHPSGELRIDQSSFGVGVAQ